jgi:hypothetical protein
MTAQADRDLLRLVAPQHGRALAAVIASEEGVTKYVALGFGGSFGSGSTWGTFSMEKDGLHIYQQGDGSRRTVPWSVIREVRSSTPQAMLAELVGVEHLYTQGPRYRLHTLPVHLRPESPERDRLTREQWTAACAEVEAAWRREVFVPFWEHRSRADARCRTALVAVLDPATDEPGDLLDMLAALEGASA